MIEPIAYEVIVTTRAALPPHNPCHLSVQQSRPNPGAGRRWRSRILVQQA